MNFWDGLILISISLAGGIGVGTAVVSFVIVLDIVPRLVQLTKTHDYSTLYEIILMFGVLVFTVSYLFPFKLPLSNLTAIAIGLLMGIFIGMLAAALEEVLNVIPIIKERLNIDKGIFYIIMALSLGKIFGSLMYWIYPSIYH